MRKIRFAAWTPPLALLLLCFMAFGLLIPRLGFYWDDWPSIWFLHFFGSASFEEGFAIDRPLLAWVFRLTTPFVGEAPWAWQTFGVLARWSSGLALWWMLRGLWPRRPLQITAVTALFLIYPGFTQQYISVTYSNAFIVFTIFLLSLGCMVWAVRCPRCFWPLLLLSIAASAFCLFTAEYFFGLEFLRPVLLWLLFASQTQPRAQPSKWRLPDEWRARLGRIALFCCPYLILMLLFLVWRIFLHESPRGQILIFDQLRANPLHALLGLAAAILQDLFEVNIAAWAQTLDLRHLLPLFDLSPWAAAGYFLVVAVAALLSISFLALWQEEELPPDAGAAQLLVAQQARQDWALQAVLLGVYALLIGGWPFWVTNLHLELFFPWDRFTLPMILGASLLAVGLVTFLARRQKPWAIILGVLIGFTVGWHYQLAWSYRQEWLAQRDFFWQLAWRAPALQPGTLLLTSELPFAYYSDNSLAAPLNWTYAPDLASRQMPYMLYTVEGRLGSWLPSLEPDTAVWQPYRVTEFNGSTSQTLVFFSAPPRCLKVMHPIRDANLPYKPRDIPSALSLSRPDLILPQADPPAQPPLAYFAPEPPHGWCYYFEKAELACQQGDWAQAASLADEAMQLGKNFDRETASELTPFIDAYARSARWDDALRLSSQALQASPKMQNLICSTWYYIAQETSPTPGQQAAIAEINQTAACNFP